MARLGLDYETVSKINPRLIYCSITGYGQNGPKRDVAGHDLNYIGDAGLLSLSMGLRDRPVVPPALIADIAGGAYPAVINILLALQERARTGRGRFLDVSMAENVFPFMYWAIGNGLAANKWPENGRELVTGGSPRYHLYPTADGRMVAAAPLEQKFWENFCEMINLEPELRDDSKDPDATIARVAELIAAETSETWKQRFAGRDCCCTIVATVEEALADSHFRSRGLFDHVLSSDDGRTLPALPVPIAPAFRSVPGEPLSAPALGAHNEEYL
jgi:crotonobetainyl-CoA:carnitine CoA-transferase CaiB-like acyl-CoA transferase